MFEVVATKVKFAGDVAIAMLVQESVVRCRASATCAASNDRPTPEPTSARKSPQSTPGRPGGRVTGLAPLADNAYVVAMDPTTGRAYFPVPDIGGGRPGLLITAPTVSRGR